MTILFSLTLFISSALLFLVEPMFAKMLLPLLGGAPAVWNTCMVFFQITLLAGYGCAHLSLSRIKPRRQIPLHMFLLLIPILILPVRIGAGWRPPVEGNPIPAILLLMLGSVGLPFLALSTSSSILQRWFSFTSHESARDPYFLYVASNAGSLAGLFGYLVVVEPRFTLREQSLVWTGAYGSFLLLMAVCAIVTARSSAAERHASETNRHADPELDSGDSATIHRTSIHRHAELDSASTGETLNQVQGDGSVVDVSGFRHDPGVRHSERSEESTQLSRLRRVIRFFASLRMTSFAKDADVSGFRQCDSLQGHTTSPHTPELPGQQDTQNPETSKPIINARRLRWVALAFVPSSLTLGFTTSITANIASVPLLWVVPLAIYLITFMIAFSRRAILPHKALLVAFPPLLALQMLFLGMSPAFIPWGAPVTQILTFFTAAMICHKELANDRPAAYRLTEFYLLLALGGALGGAFNALVAPIAFDSAVEYPLVLVLAAMLWKWPSAMRIDVPKELPHRHRRPNWIPAFAGMTALLLRCFGSSVPKPEILSGPNSRNTESAQVPRKLNILDLVAPACLAVFALVAIRYAVSMDPPQEMAGRIAAAKLVAVCVCLSFIRRPIRFGLGLGGILLAMQIAQPPAEMYAGEPKPALYQERSFFGISRVEPDPQEQFHQLFHGTIVHGMQCMVDGQREKPLTYYSSTGPAGRVFWSRVHGRRDAKVGLIGLGAGALAAYAEDGQTFVFYEIDPVVVRIASNPEYFTYVQDARDRGAIVKLKLGDGRLGIASAPDGSFDLIVVDAFSGDSVPTHLLTTQAIQLYIKKLKPRGVIAFHISNAFLDLRQVTAATGAAAGAVCVFCDNTKLSPEDLMLGKSASVWMLMGRSVADVRDLASAGKWPIIKSRGDRPWTDDYSNILQVFSWKNSLVGSLVGQ